MNDSTQEQRARIALMHAPTEVEPPPHLWPRIAASHTHRLRRRRRQRALGAFAGGVLAVVAAVLLVVPRAQRTAGGDVDWQARAQALELELRGLAASNAAGDAALIRAGTELDEVDHALQSAYDRNAPQADVVPLWKRRSELLRLMISQREQRLAITQI